VEVEAKPLVPLNGTYEEMRAALGMRLETIPIAKNDLIFVELFKKHTSSWTFVQHGDETQKFEDGDEEMEEKLKETPNLKIKPKKVKKVKKIVEDKKKEPKKKE
jgi:hypothetical protein